MSEVYIPAPNPLAFVILSVSMLLVCIALYIRYARFPSWKCFTFCRSGSGSSSSGGSVGANSTPAISAYVTFAVLLGWWLNSLIVFVIPLDVSSSLYLQCAKGVGNPGNCQSLLQHPPILSYLDPSANGPLYWIWRVIYWTAYFSIWIVYPLLTSYSISPQFKPSKRWWGAIKENLLYYGIYFAVAVGLVLWVAIGSNGQATWTDILGMGILIGNTFGLFLVICLLSIGLVRVPRYLWRLSRRHIMLKQTWWHISETHEVFVSAKRKWMGVLKIVHNADRNVPKHNHNRKYVDAVIASVPPEDYETVVVAEGDYDCTYDGMVALHGQVLDAHWDLVRCKTLFYDNIHAAVKLEDIISHSQGHQVWWHSSVRWSIGSRRRRCWSPFVNTVESWWYRYLEQIFLKLLAIWCALLSVLVVWTEVTLFTLSVFKLDLSIFSLLLGSAATPFAVELLVWIPVTYITVCVFSSLFAVKIMHFYRFLPGGVTNARTLLMSASYMGRLVPPLVYNFLMMIHCTPISAPNFIRSSAYSELMGSMKAFQIMGDAFIVFFPMVLVVLVVIVLTNVGARLLSLCRVKQFEFDDNFDDENIANGERILRTEKQVLERNWGPLDEESDGDDSAGPLVEPVANIASRLDAAPVPSNLEDTPPSAKSHLPRGQAGLLRSLEASPATQNESSKGRVGDDILDF